MKKNAYLNQMAEQYGAVEYEGKTYVLLQQSYMDGRQNPDWCSSEGGCSRWIDAHYEARAVCLDDIPDELNAVPAYLIRWEILPETWEYWGHGGEAEGDACDWEHPESVREYGGWDLDGNRCC